MNIQMISIHCIQFTHEKHSFDLMRKQACLNSRDQFWLIKNIRKILAYIQSIIVNSIIDILSRE